MRDNWERSKEGMISMLEILGNGEEAEELEGLGIREYQRRYWRGDYKQLKEVYEAEKDTIVATRIANEARELFGDFDLDEYGDELGY